jgi:hypothetical protein
MKRAKSILIGATTLALAAGSAAYAQTDSMNMEDSTTSTASTMYEVDEDHDGRTDRMLILEQSDSLA